MDQGEFASIASLRLFDSFLRSLPVAAQMKMFGQKLPPMVDYRKELLVADGHWPPGVDKRAASEYMETSYWQSKNLPFSMETAFSSGKQEAFASMIPKRLNPPTNTRMKWYTSPDTQLGSVCPEEWDDQCIYPSNIRHNFANQSYREEIICGGKTHVAVGFVDLGFLLNAQIKDSENGPLRFVGVERCPFSVAKTLVIWEILRMDGEEEMMTRAALQVWYSSGWEDATLDVFKTSVSRVLSKGYTDSDEVERILIHWHSTESVALKVAREAWSRTNGPNSSFIANFQHKSDRVDMARYELTGDVALSGIPTQGSITRFAVPKMVAESAKDESIFAVVDFSRIKLDPKKTIFKSVEEFLLSRIQRLRRWAIGGVVTVELHCKSVERFIPQIAALHPWTISWSNVLDYFDDTKFHQIARACSIHGDTIHFGCSMNWPGRTFGTCLLDMHSASSRADIIRASREAQKQHLTLFGLADRLRHPLPGNPLNSTGDFLAIGLHKH